MVSRLARWLKVIFGEVRWSPPAWLGGVWGWLRRGMVGLGAERRGRPLRFYGALAGLALAVAVGFAGGWWWVHRPLPVLVEVSASSPLPTPLRDGAVPEPLRVTFSASAAPLENVGHPVTEGLSVSPPLAGEWRWDTDSLLVFRPAGDWPVGVAATLRIEPRALRGGVLLARYDIPLFTPGFAALVYEFAFNDDPVDPLEKTVVATVLFSHPIDKTELERRIELRFRVDPVTSFDDASVRKLAFRTSYDERGGKAFIRSERIALPDRQGEVRLELASGVRAARGGPGTAEPLRRTARVPSVETYFRLERRRGRVRHQRAHEVERLVALQATAPLRQTDLAGQVELFLLPPGRPALGDQPAVEKDTWRDPREIVPEVLALARRLDFDVGAERARVHAAPRRSAIARPPAAALRARRRGARSLGGYALVHEFDAVLPVEAVPARRSRSCTRARCWRCRAAASCRCWRATCPALEFELARLLPGTSR